MSSEPTAIESFVCLRLPGQPRLSRASCAEKHAAAKRDVRGHMPGSAAVLRSKDCLDCPIGAAHKRGERPEAWPDGSPIETTMIRAGSSRWLGDKDSETGSGQRSSSAESGGDGELGVDGAGPTGGAAAPNQAATTHAERASEPPAKETRMPAAGTGRKISFDGRTLTSAEWAREPDIIARGLKRDTIDYRVRQGWSTRDVLTKPPGQPGSAKPRPAIAPPAPKRTAPAPVSSPAIAGPLELLVAAGYDASAIEVPAGLMIVVKL